MSKEATPEGATPEEIIDQKIDAILEPATQAQEPEEGEGEQPPEEEPETPEEEEEPEQETEESPLTLANLAEVLGVDEDLLDLDDGRPVFKTKIDGEEGKVSLNDALKSYQLEGHLNKQNMEVVEQRKKLDAELNKFNEERQTKIQQLEDTLALAANDLTNEYQSIDWDKLKSEDTTRYLVLQQEYQERQNRLGQSFQQLQITRQEESQKQQEKFLETLQSEQQKLRTTIPGWDDDSKFDTGKKEIRKSLQHDYGFTDQEIDTAYDHRLIVMARDAMEYRKLLAAKPETIKKIAKAPKVVKGGTSIETSSKDFNLKKAVAAVKKSGVVSDEYLEAKGII